MGEEDQGYRRDLSARASGQQGGAVGLKERITVAIALWFLLLQFFEFVHIKCFVPTHVNEDLDTSIKFQ